MLLQKVRRLQGTCSTGSKTKAHVQATLTCQGRHEDASAPLLPSETVGGMRGSLKPSHRTERLCGVLLAISHTTLTGVAPAAGAVADVRGVVTIQLQRKTTVRVLTRRSPHTSLLVSQCLSVSSSLRTPGTGTAISCQG